MRVLVTGGAGYIGSVLVRRLLAAGHAVRVVDRLFFGAESLADVRTAVEVWVGDIRQISVRELEGTDAVINLAGISSDPTAEFKPELTREMNVTGAVRLAQACVEAGVGRYLFASSCSVYDADRVDDESDALLDETSPVRPVSMYARSKREAELALLALADRSFSPVILRMGTVYGFSPRMRYDLVINTLLKDALSRGCMVLLAGGETWRPVVEVRDAADAYMACLDAAPAVVDGQIFNVVFANFRVCEMALRIREALRSLGILTDVRAEYTQRKARSYRVSGRKLRAALGVGPTVSIEDSVTAAVHEIWGGGLTDFEDPNYYNIRRLERLEEAMAATMVTG